MRVSALIPVKASSSRLPGKNILPFADTNLLIHKIRQLKQVSEVTEIIVSSDSDAMLQMALDEGVVAVKRPADLANESRPFGDLVAYVCELLKNEHLMWSCVTSPTVDAALYSNAIKTYFEALKNGYDSLTTVIPFKHFLLDAKGPFNFDPDRAVTNSQDLPNDMYLWTCGCSLISKKLARTKRYIIGSNIYRLIVSPYQGIDIDTLHDYEMAIAMWRFYNDKQ